MKKNPLLSPLCLAAAAALVLSACGQSVEDARADAYNRLSQMPGLTASQVQEYEAQLNSAADTAAIKHILENAQQANDTKLADDVQATERASQAVATAAAASKLKESLTGVTLIGTSPECLNMTLRLENDFEGFQGTARQPGCLGIQDGMLDPVNISKATGHLSVQDLAGTIDKGPWVVQYSVTVDESGTYTFELVSGTDRYGVQGRHTFVVSSPSS